MPYLSLVIPCFNEAANLTALVRQCEESLGDADLELILVDNGSTDDSRSVLTRLLDKHRFARSVRVGVNRGYGFGILAGLQAATGTVLGWTHADLQTDPADSLAALPLFLRAPDPDRVFVKGSRRGRPLGEVFFTTGMSIFESMLLRSSLWDINAQPTLFGRGFMQSWSDPPHDFSLDLFAYYQARRRGLEVHRIPVLFQRRAHGTSHWNVSWRAKMKFIRRTIDYSLRLRRALQQQ